MTRSSQILNRISEAVTSIVRRELPGSVNAIKLKKDAEALGAKNISIERDADSQKSKFVASIDKSKESDLNDLLDKCSQ